MPRESGDLRLMTSTKTGGAPKRRVRDRGAKSGRGQKPSRAAIARRQAEAPPESRPRRKVIAVTCGKGGVGKTNIVTHLAIALPNKETRVRVLDGELGLGDVDR